METRLKIHEPHAVDVTEFYKSRWQRRRGFDEDKMRDLMADIAQHGVHDPLLYFVNEQGQKELLTGHRRCRASMAALMEFGTKESQVATACAPNFWETFAAELRATYARHWHVPARAVTGELAELHALHARDNLQRDDLGTLALAETLADYITAHEVSQTQAAKAFGKTQAWVSQMLSLVSLDPEVQEQVVSGELSQSVAQVVAKLPAAAQRAAAQELVNAEAEGTMKASARAAKKAIAAVQQALDWGLEFWEIPEHERVEPEIWNYALVIREALQDKYRLGAADQDTPGLTALYMRLHLDKYLKHPYKLRSHQIRMVKWAISPGDYYVNPQCETCQLGGCDSEHALVAGAYPMRSCYLPAGAPFMVELNPELLPLLDCHTCEQRVTFKNRGDETHYCTAHECYAKMLEVADTVWELELQRREAERQRLQDANVQKRLALLRQHHQTFQELRHAAGVEEFPFYARCEQCIHWRQDHCKYATEPDFDRDNEPLIPGFELYRNGTEQLFPACLAFSYRDLADIPELETGMDKQFVLALLVDAFTHKYRVQNAYVLTAYANINPNQTAYVKWLRQHHDRLTTGQLAYILSLTLHQREHDWGTGDRWLVESVTGVERKWLTVHWREWLAARSSA